MPSSDPKPSSNTPATYGVIALLSVSSPLITYLIATTSLSYDAKVAGVVAVSLTSAVMSIIYIWRLHRAVGDKHTGSKAESNFSEKTLVATADGGEHHLSKLLTFDRASLFAPEGASGRVRHLRSFGPLGRRIAFPNNEDVEDLAVLAYLSGEVEIARAGHSADELRAGSERIALPLIHENDVFAILVIESPAANISEFTVDHFVVIADEVAPHFLGSVVAEASLASSLTDPVTGLANERAMLMVLENQLAESRRFRDERPLGLLTVDVRNFAAINETFGPEIGDGLLAFCAENLRLVLRKMDLAARSATDEFYIVLPATGHSDLLDALGRIARHFDELYFEADETGHIPVRLNFGWASFWEDGETAEELIHAALARKEETKAEEMFDVAGLKKEYVH